MPDRRCAAAGARRNESVRQRRQPGQVALQDGAAPPAQNSNQPVMELRLETGFGDQYWCTHLQIESGADQYAWVNRTLFVGQGRAVTDGVEYEVYRLA